MVVRVALFEASDIVRSDSRRAVLPILESLDDMGRIELVRHERFTGLDDLAAGLSGWRSIGPSLAYVRANGRAGALTVERNRIDISEVAEAAKNKLGNKALYFAWASMLSGRKEKARSFLKTSGALGVYGFGGPVDWWQGVAFDLLFLESVGRVGMGSRLAQDMTWRYPDLVKRLGFTGEAGRMPGVLPVNPLRWLPPFGA